MMKTFSAKPSDVNRLWYVVDASEISLGRVATQVATLLTGKGKPQFTQHIDTGDYVIVINAQDLKVTGNKVDKKIYYRHSNFPGGLKERTLREQMEKDPSEVVIHAVRGMLPVNKLRDGRLARLKVYAGSEHNHEAQKPVSISMKEGK
ncbi:MAG TPA: 50S ribosomal protein L13 [Candidatus Saccharimonadales bacterium]|nr:50S ribosomal protein L13 [Candidatus Saccharimonadales bacterium]